MFFFIVMLLLGKRHRAGGAFCFMILNMDEKQVTDIIDLIDEELEDLRASLEELEVDLASLKDVLRGAGVY